MHWRTKKKYQPFTMLASIALFLCLTVLTVASRSETECQPEIIRCPCGKSNTTVQISLSCDEHQKSKYSCTRFKNCETCEDGLKFCRTCPAGKSAAFCSEKTALNEGLAPENLVRNRRQSQRCPTLESPKPGSMQCLYDDVKGECTGTCSPGHAFPDGETEKIFRCNYNSRTWSPQSFFPKCKSSGQCDLQIMGGGSYNCTISNQGTVCDIRCFGFRPISGRFFCFPGEEWEPRLPYCTKKKEVTSPPPRCYCQNGGICDPLISRCNCPSGYRGRRCQNKIEVTSPPPRCYCRNGGTCDPTTLKCRCPPDYEGRRCQNKIEPIDLEYCDNPGIIINGEREVIPPLNERRPLQDDSPEFPEGTKLMFSCRDGYRLQGDNTLSCVSGFWSPEEKPSCTASGNEGRNPQQFTYCNDPGEPANGGRYLSSQQDLNFRDSSGSRGRYPLGTEFVFYCDDNFVLRGEDLVTCTRRGFWSSPLPVCNYESED